MNRNDFEISAYFFRVYVKAWVTASLAVKAPNSALSLLKCLKKYADINDAISEVTNEKMAHHLWHLSEELVGLSLFDDDVMPSIKEKMAQAILQPMEKETPVRKASVSLDTITSKTLEDFASSNTCLLFQKLNLLYSFLYLPVAQWNENFKISKDFCKSSAVTNDHAERSVALVQNFSGRLTKEEEQLQYLLQVVSQHRKDFSQPLKSALL